MRYRRSGRLDFEVSALSFGCMRLPTVGDDARIDEPEAIRMIRHAVDSGVNYFDTAYVYHGGQSEQVLGRALRDGYRDRVKIATKLPHSLVTEPAHFDRIFDEQVARLDVDRVDFYLLHNSIGVGWDRVRDLGYIPWAERQVSAGRIGHLGFSCHDRFPGLKHIIDDYDGWAMVQLQYNYMDVENQAGTEGVRYAASKGLAVVVMEPLLGGRLANPPSGVQRVFDRAPVRRSSADWALQWLWDQPEVTTALSGMSAFGQLEENLASAEASAVGAMTAAEHAVIAAARDAYNALSPVPCTQCRYCMPCPSGVDIPWNFLLFNRGAIYEQFENVRRFRYPEGPVAIRAGACVACHECEEKCPQSIPIADWLKVVHKVLAEGAEYAPGLAPRP